MAVQLKDLSQIIDIRPLDDTVGQDTTKTLLKTDEMEIVRLMMPTGKEILTHTAPGEMTVQCLEGQAELTVQNESYQLEAGQLLQLPANEPHSIRGIKDGSLLLTILLP